MESIRYEIADRFDALAFKEAYWSGDYWYLSERMRPQQLVITNIRAGIAVFLNNLWNPVN